MEYELIRHSGVKGMKWGIRRYQNKDGTLTAAGKRRYAKTLAKVKEEERILKNQQATKAKIDRLNARVDALNQQKGVSSSEKKHIKSRDKTKVETAPKKKTLADMSDEELNKLVTRLDLEKRYRDHNPQTVSKGKQFISGMMDKAVVPAVQEVAKSTIKTALSSAIKKMTEESKNK